MKINRASEARQAQRAAPCGQVIRRGGHVVKCLHLSIMSMPQVHLSIRQIRHAGSKLVWGGWGPGRGCLSP